MQSAHSLRFIAAFLLLTVVIFAISLKFTATSPPEHKELRESAGNEEDQGARATWEWMRLRVPSTGLVPPDIRVRELAFARGLPTVESLTRAKGQRASENSVASVNWTGMGPINIGGRTRALAIDVTNPNVIIAGGVSGGMWRSTDLGQSWTKGTASTDLHSVSCVVQDHRPGKTNTFYYGTGELFGNSANTAPAGASYSGNGVYKSTNGGISWFSLTSTLNLGQGIGHDFSYVLSVAVDNSNTASDVVYASTITGIFRSMNGGTTWTKVHPLAGQQSCEIAITSTGVIYATMTSGLTATSVWRSPDGISWTNISPIGGTTLRYGRKVIGIAPSNENVLYILGVNAGRGEHDFWKYTYISGDGSGPGGAWENRAGNLPDDFDTQIWYDMVVRVKPDDENTVFIGGIWLYRSTDGFATNGKMEIIGTYSPYLHVDQHALEFSPSDPNVLFVGNDGGVYRTTQCLAANDQINFTSLNHGYTTTQFYTVAVNHESPGDMRVIGGMQDNGTCISPGIDPGTPWKELDGGDGAYCALTSGFAYVGNQMGWISRYQLDTNNAPISMVQVDPHKQGLFINPWRLDPNNPDLMYVTGGDRLWRNPDLKIVPASVNWSDIQSSVLSPAMGQDFISAIGVSRTPANRVYFGTVNGRIFRIENADRGQPPSSEISAGKGLPEGGYVSSIAVDPFNADRVLVSFSNYWVQSLYWTTDGGATWSPCGGNLEQLPDGSGDGPSCRMAAIVPGRTQTHYFLATTTGLYSTDSINGMSTVWAQEGMNTIGNVVVDMIDARVSDGYVAIGTHGHGVFTGTIPDHFVVPSATLLQIENLGTNAAVVRGQVTPNGTASSAQFEYGVSPFFDLNTPLHPIPASGGPVIITDTLRNLEPLSPYDIRLAVSTVTGTVRSTSRVFYTLPLPPVVVNPRNGTSMTAGGAGWFEWTSPQTVSGFEVAFSTDSLFTGWVVLVAANSGNGLWCDSLPVPERSTIYWRVRAFFNGLASGWSEKRFFTTSYAMPAQVTARYPEDRATNIPPNITLLWSRSHNATGYRFDVNPDSTFSTVAIVTGSMQDTSYALELETNTTYFWRVMPYRYNVMRSAIVWRFSTGAGLPGTVALLFPSPDATVTADNTLFRWSKAYPEVDRYRFMLHKNSADGSVWIDTTIADTSLYIQHLLNSSMYYWSVTGGNATGWGSAGESRMVRVLLSGVQETDTQAPRTFDLLQNFPNPCNPTSVIRYAVPRRGHVTMQLYDIQGHLVSTLVSANLEAGYYVVEFDGRQLASGVYFYRMQASGYLSTRKLLLIH